MPIEIKELVIRAVVDNEERSDGKSVRLDTNEIVEICVQEVLRVLKRSQER